MAPTVKFDFAGEDGKVTEKHIQHYKERAGGGVGLICVEATAVTPRGRFFKNHLGLWEDEQIEGHKEIVNACHDNDVVVLIQLNHTGITINSEVGVPFGPSAVPTMSGAMSVEMTVDEMHEMQQKYVDAAIRAKEAGYDGIQLHGCHRYLINQFVYENTNFRSDKYGGSVQNRGRFASEIIEKIRKECEEDFIISVRTVGADNSIEDSIAIAEEYVKAGCDYLQVSHGFVESDPSLQKKTGPFTEICSMGVKIHDYFKGRVPVSCVNGILEPYLVKILIKNDFVDTVDLARAVLADPRFPKAVLHDTPYVKCYTCKKCQYGPFAAHRCPAEIKRAHQK